MTKSLWPFAEDFRVWHTAPPTGPLSFFRLSSEFHDANLPLTFQGTKTALSQLFDPNAAPPYPLNQFPRLNKEFVCWLLLPGDAKGTEWYFGCVTFERQKQKKSKKLFDEFRELAASAGACLRQDEAFREWLWPCLQYLSQADRHPKLLDGADAAWWLALLFTKPELGQRLHTACTRSQVDGVIRFEIDNPAHWSRRAIKSRQLEGVPVWPKVNCRVAPPFREIACPEFFAANGPDQTDKGFASKSDRKGELPTPAASSNVRSPEDAPHEWTDWVLTKNAKKWFKDAEFVTSSSGWTSFANGLRGERRMVNHPTRKARMIRIHKSIFARFGMPLPDITI